MRTTCALGGCERLRWYATVVGRRRGDGGPWPFPVGRRGGMARRTVLLPAALMVAVLMTCAPAVMMVESQKAEAAFPGNNCKIAFLSYDGHDQGQRA